MYKNRLKLFDFGSQILPGITAIDSSGHTPGHTAYEIADGENKIVIVGDAIISEAQMLRPELYSIHDMDPATAAQFRSKLLKHISDNDAILIGMHMDKFGKIEKDKNNRYVFKNANSPSIKGIDL